MFVAEAAVLAWGLVLALLRATRGRVTAPLRWLAVGYIDLFRAIPGIVLIYMIASGSRSPACPGSAPGPSTAWPRWP
jgi:ABC-type amino acid transport system permease subunit